MSTTTKSPTIIEPSLTGWAVYGRLGGYYRSLMDTRSAAIAAHCADFGIPWKCCRAQGDRCIRVEQRPLTRPAKKP